MQKPDGSFYSKYFQGEGPDDSWTSLYYPGEAMLGLVRLYESDGNRRWLEAADRGMGYLARSRADEEDVPPDHWALLATEGLLNHLAALPEPPAGRDLLLRHARQICEGMLGERQMAARAGVTGALTKDARTCPTATRLEGLQAALVFLPETDTALRSRLETAVAEGIRFLLDSQLASGALAGGFPHVGRRGNRPPGDRTRAGQVRMDYVQHALCALLQYRESKSPVAGG